LGSARDSSIIHRVPHQSAEFARIGFGSPLDHGARYSRYRTRIRTARIESGLGPTWRTNQDLARDCRVKSRPIMSPTDCSALRQALRCRELRPARDEKPYVRPLVDGSSRARASRRADSRLIRDLSASTLRDEAINVTLSSHSLIDHAVAFPRGIDGERDFFSRIDHEFIKMRIYGRPMRA